MLRICYTQIVCLCIAIDYQGIIIYAKSINLNCSNNQLTSLDLNKNTELIYLECKENPFTQESINDLLNSLPMGKYDNGKPISELWIDDKWDTSIAEEKGWKINSYF